MTMKKQSEEKAQKKSIAHTGREPEMNGERRRESERIDFSDFCS